MRQTKILITAVAIQTKTDELAAAIARDYHGKQLLLIGILKGSVLFMSDLLRSLWQQGLTDCQIDFMGISSYGQSTESSRNPHITKDLDLNIEGRHLLIVEDIIDTGHSLDALQRILRERHPASIKTVVLLSKPSRREVHPPVDYIGFEVDGWVEGYGLDTDEFYRGRPEVVEVVTS